VAQHTKRQRERVLEMHDPPKRFAVTRANAGDELALSLFLRGEVARGRGPVPFLRYLYWLRGNLRVFPTSGYTIAAAKTFGAGLNCDTQKAQGRTEAPEKGPGGKLAGHALFPKNASAFSVYPLCPLCEADKNCATE
jgi:hypothetical protein